MVGTAAALSPIIASPAPRYVVGAKNFSEQFILARLIVDRLGAKGAKAAEKDGLGSAVIFRALAANDLDVYVDYSGTLWADVLKRTDAPPRAELLAQLTQELKRRYGVTVLGSLGFENAYALAMRGDRAAALGVRDIADLAGPAPTLTLNTDIEFLSRPEWAKVRDTYGLRFRATRSFNPTFLYRALESGGADVISAFSSDGRIAADHLTVLADPKGAIPSYDAVLLLSPRRADDRRLKAALQPLVGKIPVDVMRRANLSVARDKDKATPGQAARALEGRLRLN